MGYQTPSPGTSDGCRFSRLRFQFLPLQAVSWPVHALRLHLASLAPS